LDEEQFHLQDDLVNRKSKIVNYQREGMGVEPTAAGFAPPATNFEDWGAHRDTSPPRGIVLDSAVKSKRRSESGKWIQQRIETATDKSDGGADAVSVAVSIRCCIDKIPLPEYLLYPKRQLFKPRVDDKLELLYGFTSPLA